MLKIARVYPVDYTLAVTDPRLKIVGLHLSNGPRRRREEVADSSIPGVDSARPMAQ
jgi:hypothetical protein